jgi:hypothetical protein
LSDKPLANQRFQTLDALEETLAEHGDRLQHQSGAIHGATYFHWWSAA